MRGEARGRQVFGAVLFANATSESVEFRGDGGKLVVARGAKGVDDLLIGCTFNRAGAEDGRFAAGGFDLLLEPLEVLVRFLVSGKDVDRVLDGDRAQLLQLPPDAHAEVRRPRRELMNQ